jgi:replicative DNA helicase
MRVPPHSVEGEQSLLGALLLDADAFDEVAAQIKADDFYKESHRHIYRAMEQISTRKEAIDVVTLVQQLRDEERLDAVGGIAYIASLSNAVATAANVTHYAGLVRKKSLLRRVIQLSTETAESCYGDVGDVEAFINEAEAKLLSLASEKATNPVRSLKDVVRDAYYQIEALYEKEESITGVPSGFVDLDYITAGWQSSDLIIVAARPAMGKTAFTLNMACNSAMRFGRSVLFCSLEMSATQLAMRLMASEARVDVSRLRTGGLKEHEWSRLISATASLSKASIFIDDTAGLTPQMLSSRARRLKVEHGLDMIMIDYLQLMNTSSKTQSREQQISEVSRTLKMLAKELHIPVMALAQLNRGVEARADKRPMLSDLRESGAIEQDADIISFVYRDEYYNPESDKKGIAEIIIGKHRSGSTGTVELRFFPEFTRFENLARDGQDG